MVDEGVNMSLPRIALLSITILLSACSAPTIRITSNPSDAILYAGEDKDVSITEIKTPFLKKGAIGTNWSPWCYKLAKEGYQSSEIVCRPQEENRNIHIELAKLAEEPVKAEPKPAIKFQATVSITGAASTLSKLTTTETAEKNPRLSPDNKWLLFEVRETGGNPSYKSVLFKLNISNNQKIILTQKSDNSLNGSWTPDAKSIVYATDKLGSLSLVQSYGISGETSVRFITPPSFSPATEPDISPDGKQVAFTLNKSFVDSQICVVDIDGRNLRVYGKGSEPKWSPDGKTLLFSRIVGKSSKIYTMNSADGSNLTELSSVESFDYSPIWSPDGEKIAFISDRVRDRWHLFLMGVTGQNIIQITDGDFDVNSMDWGKDNSIYFSSNAGGNWDIWRLKVEN